MRSLESISHIASSSVDERNSYMVVTLVLLRLTALQQ